MVLAPDRLRPPPALQGVQPPPSTPAPPPLRVPMGPVEAARVGASGRATGQPHLLASLFRKAPSVRAVLLSTTMLVSTGAALVPSTVSAQVNDRERVEMTAPSRLSSQLLDHPSLGPVMSGDMLEAGAEGEAVERVQRALAKVGIALRGGADGDFGGGTAAAIEAFTRRAKIAPRDFVDRGLLLALDAEVKIAESLSTPRLSSTPTFLEIAVGRTTLAEGTTDRETTEIVQATLYALGEDLGPAFIDADFGGATTAAIRSFQAKADLPQTGELDQATLFALDEAASAQLATLRSQIVEPGTKHERYSVVGDLVTNRLYVVDKTTNEPVARYLTSPGKPGYRTRGDEFTVQRTMVRKTWYPTPSMNAQPIGPGLKNPMGLVKFNLGRYYQYIHGTPFSVRDALGTPASRGCLRMSTENILELVDYIEPGTHVAINRDAAESQRLAEAAERLGVDDAPLDAGRERLAAFLTGEMGQDESLR